MGNIVSYLYSGEKNSITPNSFAPMPPNKFHNYAIERRSSPKSQKQKQQLREYKNLSVESLEDFFDKYNH
jgi:hypothetical protein